MKTTTENTDNGLSVIPTNINNLSPKHENFKTEIVTQQSKAQKDFKNKIEKEQIKITEEMNELKDTFAREIKKHVQNLNLTITTKRGLQIQFYKRKLKILKKKTFT